MDKQLQVSPPPDLGGGGGGGGPPGGAPKSARPRGGVRRTVVVPAGGFIPPVRGEGRPGRRHEPHGTGDVWSTGSSRTASGSRTSSAGGSRRTFSATSPAAR